MAAYLAARDHSTKPTPATPYHPPHACQNSSMKAEDPEERDTCSHCPTLCGTMYYRLRASTRLDTLLEAWHNMPPVFSPQAQGGLLLMAIAAFLLIIYAVASINVYRTEVKDKSDDNPLNVTSSFGNGTRT